MTDEKSTKDGGQSKGRACPTCGQAADRRGEGKKKVGLRGARYVDDDQVRALLEVAPLGLVKLIVLTYGLGARLAEALLVTSNEIDRRRNEVAIGRSRLGTLRKFRVDPQLLDFLEVAPGSDSATARRMLRIAAKKAGLGDVYFTDLRNGFVSRLVQTLHSPEEIALAIGKAGRSRLVDLVYAGTPVFDVRGSVPMVAVMMGHVAAQSVAASENQPRTAAQAC